MRQRYPNSTDPVGRRRRPLRFGTAILLGAAVVPVLGCGADVTNSSESTTVAATTTQSATPVATALPAVPRVDPYADTPLIDHTTWTNGIDGLRLQIYPTQAGRRTTFPDAEERAWQEILTMSTEADTPGMRDQFVCHWVWARAVQPNKESWNLEPWRPAVGYQATVQATCNPGGPER